MLSTMKHRLKPGKKSEKGNSKQTKKPWKDSNQRKEINEVKGKLLNTLNAMPDFPKNAVETLSFLYIFLAELKKWQCAYES